ncbi:hypothetical protein BC938DRAFT_479832 [Jimgerdemannia flammicorona]|uniref:Short-chain dehydrogenase n=1 Tax=Jimgerdemannia flammicorona TaxID=994334 RepID=A0A433QK12_9FUNG|nr:hypothetical protein BC938DRAFT_479832 [Jimgerdemannia flammicorona]
MGKYSTFNFVKGQWESLSFEPQDLSEKVIIVTGSNVGTCFNPSKSSLPSAHSVSRHPPPPTKKKKFLTGIGYDTAKALARMNPTKLILACRNVGKAKKAVDEIKTVTGFQDIEPWDLDLASFASVRAFAKRFDESGLQLHVLLNNAAVASPPDFRTDDGFETTLQVNHLSTMLLTLLLLPAIRRTTASLTWAPRIILLTSEVHYWADLPERTAPNILTTLNNSTAWDTANRYRVTKLFNVLFVQELARRLARSPLLGDRSIVVSSVNPGLTNTNIGVGSLSFIVKKLLFGRSAERSAITSVYVATAPEVAKLTPYGRYYSNCMAEEAADLTLGVEGEELAGRLWRESLEVIEVTDAEVKL